MYITALALIAKNWKSTICPSTCRNINKVHGTFMVFSGILVHWMIKRNELLTHATTRVNFKIAMPSERSQKKKACCMIMKWLYKVLEKQRNLQGQKTDQRLPGDGKEERFRKAGRRIAKGHEETLGSHRYVHYIECNVSSSDAHVCEIFSNYIL